MSPYAERGLKEDKTPVGDMNDALNSMMARYFESRGLAVVPVFGPAAGAPAGV